MTESQPIVSPEKNQTIDLLRGAGDRLNEVLPPWFQEDAELNMTVDDVDIRILINQSWRSDDMKYDVITHSIDESGIRTSAGYHWWQSATKSELTRGHFSIKRSEDEQSGEIEQAQAAEIGTILDLYFKGVALEAEEEAKKNLFTERSFGGHILNIVRGSRLQLHATESLVSLAGRDGDEAALLLGLSNDEIRTRLKLISEPHLSVNDDELEAIRQLIKGE